MAKKSEKTVTDFWSHLGWDNLSQNFGTSTVTRGRDYAENGRVKQLWASSDKKNIVAKVSGTEDYWVAITIAPKKKTDQFVIDSTPCSCPVGYACKHAVAAIAVYLDYIANGKTPLVCEKLENDQWKLEKSKGNPMTITIFDSPDEEDDWDDFQDDDDDDFTPSKQRAPSKTKPADHAKKTLSANETLLKQLRQNTKDELIEVILQLYNHYTEVQKQFDREIKRNEIMGDDNKLRQEARQIIKETFQSSDSGRYRSRGRYDRYDDYEECPDCGDLSDFIDRLKNHPDPYELLHWLSLDLVSKIDDWYENNSNEDDETEFCHLFATIADVALTKAKPDDVARYYKWADELAAIGQYDVSEAFTEKVTAFSWGKLGLNQFADSLRDGLSKQGNCEKYSYIQRLVEIMVKAGRRKELLDLLRPLSKQRNITTIFVGQLVEAKMYDEAIARMQTEYIAGTKDRSYYGWFKQLTELVAQRKNRSLLATVYANELFHAPELNLITGLLDVAKKLNVEPTVCRFVTTYLETGTPPDVIVQILENRNPDSVAKNDWPLTVMEGDARNLDTKPHFDILCRWAIEENRPVDAILWYKKCSPETRTRLALSLAEIVWETDPDLAIEIYKRAAMRIVDATQRNEYAIAVAYLGKVKKIYEQTGRSEEGTIYIEKVRAENKRKPAFINELDKMNKRK